ncbi:MAG: hypothetical protein WBQ55_09980 [Xanthobacteraceae bacterium]
MAAILLVVFASMLAACSNQQPNNYQPPISGWTQEWGGNDGAAVPSFVTAAPNFSFPAAPHGVHYVVEPPPAGIALGKTITMSFTLTGTGTLMPSDTTDTPPATVGLYLNQSGDNFSGHGASAEERLWCGRISVPAAGSYTTSCVLDPTKWTGVYGANPTAAQFQQLLSNLYAVGFSFGGQYFAGHGVYVTNGTVSFTFNSYTIQ